MDKSSLYGRRQFISRSLHLAGGLCLSLPAGRLTRLDDPITLGLITDLHQDIMHDGWSRLKVFVDAMQAERPQAILQLGDFAVPRPENQAVIDLFNQAHPYAFHVLGNHDLDFGHTKAQCLATWRMPARYYAQVIAGLRVVILDGNDPGSPAHQGGYPSYIGPEQMQWLQNQLAEALEPILIVSHQPLAGTYPMDNAAEVQALLSRYAQKIILAINGHTHIDDVLEVGGVIYLHVNSASYVWVGESFKHDSYAQDILSAHPYIANTCPYAESLFTSLTIHPRQNTIHIKGRATTWVGPSPAEIRANTFPGLVVGEQIAPHIRPRVLQRRS